MNNIILKLETTPISGQKETEFVPIKDSDDLDRFIDKATKYDTARIGEKHLTAYDAMSEEDCDEEHKIATVELPSLSSQIRPDLILAFFTTLVDKMNQQLKISSLPKDAAILINEKDFKKFGDQIEQQMQFIASQGKMIVSISHSSYYDRVMNVPHFTAIIHCK